jgi:hypothetical protein
MISSSTSARAILVYALILPLALIMGYLLATPRELGTWATIGVVLMVVLAPIVLANHHAALFLTWNMTVMVFFLPGSPQLWLPASFLSLFISLVQRALSQETRFISVPSLIWPLVYMAVVICFTAKLTGGFSFRVLGSGNVGGRRYLTLFGAMAGFIAMSAYRIPLDKVNRYSGLFFLGSIVNGLSSLIPLLGAPFYFLFYVFPFEGLGLSQSGFRSEIIRYYGLSLASLGVVFYMLARYGVKDILSFRKPGRLLFLLCLLALDSGGGFRGNLAFVFLVLATLFCLEGLLLTRYSAAILAAALLLGLSIIPVVDKLPLSMQRTLSFLPLNVSPVARFDAQASTEWRLEMWKALWPQIPHYLWLGKGLGISAAELELTAELAGRGKIATWELSLLAGDFHNGLLSVMIPFGIWGFMGLLWFWIAGLRALYFNFRYGDEKLKTINTLLLALFIDRMIAFIFFYGSFYEDLTIFTGIIGLCIAINHGIRRSVTVPDAVNALPAGQADAPTAFAPAFARSTQA